MPAAQHQRDPDQHHREAAVAAELEADPQHQRRDQHGGYDLPRHGLADAQLFLHQDLAHLEQHEDQRGDEADAHAGDVELGDEVFADQPGQERVVLGEGGVDARAVLADEIGHEARFAVAEQAQEALVGDVHAVAVEHHVGEAAEGVHAGQRGDKGGHADLGDPEALERADGQADRQHDQHGQPHVGPARHHHAADGRREAHHRADRQVDVASRQDAQQHTGGQHEHVGVLGDQAGQVGREQDQPFLAGPEREHDGHDHQGDDHGVFLEKLTGLEALGDGFFGGYSLFAHRYAPLPDRRIAAMMFSCVASLAFISPMILASFMM